MSCPRSIRHVLALALLATPWRAGDAQTVHQGHAWLNYLGDHRLGARTALYVELSARRSDFAREWQQQVVGVGVHRALFGSYRATLTLIGQRSYPYTAAAGEGVVSEVRPWLQLAGQRRVFGGRESAWQWSDRTRIEARWQTRDIPFDADGDWQGSWRARRQDRLQRSLGDDWYAGGSQEWFMGSWPGSGGPLVEQSRTQAFVGRSLSPTFRVETGYMLQWLARRNGAREFNHTLVVQLRSSAPIR